LWFCGVKLEDPETVDWDEPEKVAFNKNHEHQTCCNTSVDRDDLKDGGSIMDTETVNHS
jgi:lipoic acid synthetase